MPDTSLMITDTEGSHRAIVGICPAGKRVFQVLQELSRRLRASIPVHRQGAGKGLGVRSGKFDFVPPSHLSRVLWSEF
jgi:hypothetical protein